VTALARFSFFFSSLSWMFNEAHVHCHRSSSRSSSSSCSHLIFESMAQQAGGTHSWLNPPLHLDRPFAGQKSTRRRWSAIGKRAKKKEITIELNSGNSFLYLPPLIFPPFRRSSCCCCCQPIFVWFFLLAGGLRPQ
jgi:hypothetical protein